MIKALLFGMPDSTPRFSVFMSLPSLGLASLAGNVDPTVCDVKIADLFPVRHRWEDYVKNLLKEQSPDIVGLSFMSFQCSNAIKIAKIIKEYGSKILVVIGGYHPSLMYEEIAESHDSPFIDFIVRGEGEATFRELVNAVNSGTGYENINGLSYKANGTFIHNAPRELLSLDSIQLPDRNVRLITKGFSIFGMSSDGVETSRGCTYNCKFCSINKMYGRSFRTYEIDRIIADIKDAQKHGIKALVITDDNITLDLERLETLCEEIIASKLNTMHYIVQATVKGIAHSEKLVKKMADAGVKMVFLGIESYSRTELDFLRKKSSTEEDTRKAVKYLRDYNIVSWGGFIVGKPDDDENSLWDTYNFAWELKLDMPAFSILTPYVKTEIREELIEMGLVTNIDNFDNYEALTANVKTKYLASQDIERILRKMYDSYLVNPRYIMFTQIRKQYPKYFWKTAFQQTLPVILSLMGKRIENER
jgi:anaerobic magnesium-protoporphyrin IX monomethyl ester cyclase